MSYYPYGEKELLFLSRKDKRLAAAIERIGMIRRETNPNTFEALVNNIIAQQISGKAADTVWNRFSERLGAVTPDAILNADISAVQKCGISMRKAEYIAGIAKAAADKTVDFQNLSALSDEEVIKQLTALRGVGVWTAEMLLIFSLERPNVLSYNDLGIRRGLMKLHGLKELTKEKFLVYQKRYSPYCTVASLYLWAISSEVSV